MHIAVYLSSLMSSPPIVSLCLHYLYLFNDALSNSRCVVSNDRLIKTCQNSQNPNQVLNTALQEYGVLTILQRHSILASPKDLLQTFDIFTLVSLLVSVCDVGHSHRSVRETRLPV